jgi:alanyl-tRNA synthetase
MQTASDIRSGFLGYFARNGHAVVQSSPLVPRNDPTLMFTNSGMVQFKNVFTGLDKRAYSRATTSQKCVRAGGKHNDLENVGYTARHHTFFEMLGNFSFGDYFKAEAIEFAWTLVTREYALDRSRLLVTVFSEDDEAFGLWKKIAGLSDDRIIRIPTSDNFWSMGETGPCGPCSEIFYDHGDKIPGGPPGSADADGDRFIEIWNLVFMQYEQVSASERITLPRPSIDTGMGLERISAVMQGTHDNYAVDLLRSLIVASAAATGTDPDGEHRVSHRVIADHVRAISFMMADGVMPSNEGRGYVLRRIMRRAMRHAHLLGARDPLLYRLVSTLVGTMGAQYPELGRAQVLIEETLKLEEGRFRVTLERGLKLLDEEAGSIGSGGRLAGDVAFRLYDTYGFPLDLTQDALRARGLGVDVDGFNLAMDRQRAEARKAWAGSGEAATGAHWFEVLDAVGPTEFLGYHTDGAEAQIVALLVDGKRVQSADEGATVEVVCNQTPFYAESGGQMGDVGTITGMAENGPAARVAVTDVQKRAEGLFVHIGRVEQGAVRAGMAVRLQVEDTRRGALRANHSATHLLHAALRRRLGKHVTQKGSLVAPDRLRFDISHPKAMTADEITVVEADVNRQIRANTDVTTRLMEPDAAVEAGAMALFGEKYGSEVRVVSMGADQDETYSTELCGGTHVLRTGDIGFFKIVAENAVAAGVRRIEALTGEEALAYAQRCERDLQGAAQLLNVKPAEVPGRIETLQDDRRRLERELTDMRRKLAAGGGSDAPAAVRQVAGISFAPRQIADVPAKDLKPLVDDLKRQIGSGVVAVVSVAEGRASLVVGVTPDLTERFDAVALVRAGSLALGGKGGGGRPDMAQAGGPDAGRAADALAAVEAALGEAG